MPIYEYQCEACGHQLERLQRISEDPLTDCPECGKPALKKMISATAFRLKGGGWYETDFKKDNRKNVERSDKQGKPKSGSEKKSDASKTSKTSTTSAASKKTGSSS